MNETHYNTAVQYNTTVLPVIQHEDQKTGIPPFFVREDLTKLGLIIHRVAFTLI